MPSYKTEDGATLHEGDRAYDYYSMKPGRIGRAHTTGDPDPWFDFEHDDGTRTLLNGARICTMEYAVRRGFKDAKLPPRGPRHDRGDHRLLSEDWLIDNLPEGWSYDCQAFTEQDGFVIYGPHGSGPLFIPLDLLKLDRKAGA